MFGQGDLQESEDGEDEHESLSTSPELGPHMCGDRRILRQESLPQKSPDAWREKLRASTLVLGFLRLPKLALEQQNNKEWRRCLQGQAW